MIASPSLADSPRARRLPRVAGTPLALGLAMAAALGFASPALADVKAGVDAWTKGDYATAVHEWEGLAAKGDADAQFDLGQAYKLGRGVKQDLAHAELLFGQAAAKGHLQAADNYGLLLFQRGEHARAMPYVASAAGRGDPRAEYLLGIAHFNGDIVPKDWVRAYALESLAQQAGLQQAKAALAQMDGFIPIEQRQQAVALEADLTQQIQATRSRQVATAQLGGNLPQATAGPSYGPAARPQDSAPEQAPAPQSAPEPAYNPPAAANMADNVPYSPPQPAAAYPAPASDRYSGFAGPSAPQGELPPLPASSAPQPSPYAAAYPASPYPTPAHARGLPPSAPRASAAAAHPHGPLAAAPAPAPISEPESDTAPAPIQPKPHAASAHLADSALSSGPWKIQLGAFGVAANAEAMWAKAKSRPEISGHARALVPTGKVSRLLATGYSEEAAHAACRKLTAAGISCLVTKD